MAAFFRIYCIGSGGGFMGQDGRNPILAQIWVGESDRQWYEGHYFHDEFAPMGRLRTLIPPAPDREDNLLDAYLAFLPAAFAEAPSLSKVVEQLGDAEGLDFHLEPEQVPPAWADLREEARDHFAKLALWRADIRPVGHG